MAPHTVPLSSVASINPNFSGEDFEADELVDFVPMAAIDADKSVISAQESRPYSEVRKGYTCFGDGDILLAKITPCFENGKISQIRVGTGVGFGSTEFHVIRPHSEKLDTRYLAHLLRQDKIRMEGERRMTGSGGQRRVPKSFLEALPIHLPPLPEQRRIAAILDKADALRAKRREALAQLDSLAQSIFVEMFGPESGLPNRGLGSLAQMKRGPFGGALKKEIFVPYGPMVFEQRNAIQDDCLTGRYFITEAKYREMEDFAVLPNDLIVSCSGTIGKVAIVPNNAPQGIINQALLRIRTNNALILPIYLKCALESKEVQNRLTGLSHGTGLQNFPPMSEVKSLAIPLPPLSEQVEFQNRLLAIHKQKLRTEMSAKNFEALFISLQHRAFRGEL